MPGRALTRGCAASAARKATSRRSFRQRGGQVLCHPGLGWLHRFPRPAGASYPNVWEDRVRNCYIAWPEIGWDLAPVRSHFRELLGCDVDVAALPARAQAQAGHPLNAFDGVFCLADGAGSGESHPHPPGISWRIERLAPGREPGSEQQRLSGWRQAVSRAARRSYQHLLVLDASAAPGSSNVPSLSEREWGLCLLPGWDTADGESIPVLDPVAGGTVADLAKLSR